MNLSEQVSPLTVDATRDRKSLWSPGRGAYLMFPAVKQSMFQAPVEVYLSCIMAVANCRTATYSVHASSFHSTEARQMSSATKTVGMIDKALRQLECIRAICFLFGLPSEDTLARLELIGELLKRRQEYLDGARAEKVWKGRMEIADEQRIIRDLDHTVQEFERQKKLLKNNDVFKIICSDRELIDLAEKIYRDESSWTCTKQEIAKYFDLTKMFSAWDRIPDYTRFLIGGGIAVSSPELDLFQALAWFYDEATRADRELQFLRKIAQDTPEQVNLDRLLKVRMMYRMMCVQTTMNAFLVLESYLNSLAYVFLRERGQELTEDQRLCLAEQTIDKSGKIRQRFVSMEDKLHEWVRIMSPRGDTFNKGGSPFQKFVKMKQKRDAVVHLSGRKVSVYDSLDFHAVQELVKGLIEIIEYISAYISADPTQVQMPWWLQRPGNDGLFNLPASFVPAAP